MSYLTPLWRIWKAYDPKAAKGQQARRTESFQYGRFKAVYLPKGGGWGVRRPRSDREAQQLYNHVRTVAFWLDAAPLLTDLGLPFRAGLDDIISLVPIYGDIVSGILQLYQVWLCFIFGVPLNILGFMFLNVIIDVFIGIVPLIGDLADWYFKSNLRNLDLLEKRLLDETSLGSRYHILLMPDIPEFIPSASKVKSERKRWFGGSGGVDEAEIFARTEEVRSGKVRRTRRMGKEECIPVEAGVGTGTGTGTGTRRQDPVVDPLD